LQVTGLDGITNTEYFQWHAGAGVLPRDAINAFIASTREDIGEYQSAIVNEFNRQYYMQAPIEGRDLSQEYALTILINGISETMKFSLDKLVNREPEALLDILLTCLKGEFPKRFVCVRPLVDKVLDMANLGILKDSELKSWEEQASALFRRTYANDWRSFVRLRGYLPTLDKDGMDYNLTYAQYMIEYYSRAVSASKIFLADRAFASQYAKNDINETTVGSLMYMLHHSGLNNDADDDDDGDDTMPRGVQLLPTGNTTVSKAYIDLETCFHILKNVVVNIAKVSTQVPEQMTETNFGMVNQSEADHFQCASSLTSNFASRAVRRSFDHQHSPTYEAYSHPADLEKGVDEQARQLQKLLAESATSASVDFREHLLTEYSVRVAGKNVFYVSAYDLFSTINIAHIMDEGQRFWSVAAARQGSSAIRKHFAGAVMFHPMHVVQENVRTFFTLCNRALVRHALENDLIIYTLNHEIFLRDMDDAQGSLQQTYLEKAGPSKGLLRTLTPSETGENVLFPMLLERPTNDVFTPPGVALMKQNMQRECVLARKAGEWPVRAYPTVISQHVKFAGSRDDGHSDDEFLVLIAYRYGSRYIHNIEEMVDSIRRKLEKRTDLSKYHRVSIQVVSFGDLHPCDQIELMHRADIFIFNHGAEGALIYFVRPGAVVVELHPAAGTMPDFGTYNVPYSSYHIISPLCRLLKCNYSSRLD
jgi:hypothetical protein